MEPTFYGLMAFLVVGALIALEMKDVLSSVIALGVVGMALSILFLLMGAPDIAITQVVVEIIVVTVLIRVSARIGHLEFGRRRDKFSTALGLALVLLFSGFALAALRTIPAFGDPRPFVANFYLQTGEPLTGCANIVMAVILDFRGYDTLGEATVILCSILGAVALLRPKAREDDGAAGIAPAVAGKEVVGE
jgi:multisubunit Na+/H+ antiporter MnhB subunit